MADSILLSLARAFCKILIAFCFVLVCFDGILNPIEMAQTQLSSILYYIIFLVNYHFSNLKVLWPLDLVPDIFRHNLAANLLREQKIREYRGRPLFEMRS